MNQLDVYCFTSIARTKSFSLTARELMISQQAVSNHIKTLEEEVGYTLFFRYGQSAVLTKAGEILLETFIKRDRLGAEFFHEHRKKNTGDPFLIAWTQWAGCPPVARKILEGFRKKYPEDLFIVADISVEKMREDLEKKRIDVIMTSQYSAEHLSTSWEHIYLCSQEICLVRSKRIEYNKDELELYPFFTVPAGESSTHTTIGRAKETCSKIGFVPKMVHICNDLGSAYLNVITSDGLSFGTENTDLPENNNLELVHTGVFSDYIMCCPFYPANPSVVRFRDYVKEWIKTIPHRSIKEAGQ